jgi:hypothetical protein
MTTIEQFQDFSKTLTRNDIRIKYQNLEYNAFLVKVDIINDDDVAITVSEHVEAWINGAWLFLQIIDVEILHTSTVTGGNTTYEGDVTIIDNSKLQFATTINGDNVYGVFTPNDNGAYQVAWFNMDGSSYTGDTTNIMIVASGFKTLVKVFPRYLILNAQTNLYFAFLEVLTFDENGILLMQNFTSYAGVAITVNASLIVEAPDSVIITDSYQSDDWFDFSDHSTENNVVGITINITNNIKRVDGIVVRSNATLYLNNSQEVVTLRRKTWNEIAPPGRRCGTKPRVQCYDGATVVCDIQRELKPIVTREKSAYDNAQMSSSSAT